MWAFRSQFQEAPTAFKSIIEAQGQNNSHYMRTITPEVNSIFGKDFWLSTTGHRNKTPYLQKG